MAQPEQPDRGVEGSTPPERITLQSPPRVYVNFAGASGSSIDLALTMGYREGDAEPNVSILAVMSWEFVPAVIRLLQDQLDSYQDQLGPVRDISRPPIVEEGPK